MPPVAAPLVALALVTGPPSPAAPGPGRSPLSLTVSGGVSLGAYQSGFLYYVAAANQANAAWAAEVKLATGASAGSVNSLLALRYSCGGLPLDPRESLFARVWLPVGFRELFRPAEVEALGALSRSALEKSAHLVEEELEAGLPLGCDVVLGVAVTRVKPRELPLAGGRTTIPRTAEKFVLRIEGRGPGAMPRITNYLDLESEVAQPALPEGPDGAVAFAEVRDLLLASAAFPVAFPPQSIRHCLVETKGKKAPFCRPEEATSALFIDGGVFDNDPLRLAAQVAAGGLEAGPKGLRWREGGLREGNRTPRDLQFAFVSADATAYPVAPARPAGTRHDSLLSYLGGELEAFIATARSKELDLLLAEYPHVSDALIYPQRHYPAASEPMFAFFGFFERSLRDFDFTLGMYEARRYLVGFSIPRLARAGWRGSFVLPEETPGALAAGPAWRPLACMRAVVDGEGEAGPLCAGPDLEQFRVLLQASLDRLWNDCRIASAGPMPSSFRACEPVLAGAAEPRVPGLAAAPAARADSESDTEYVVRLLAAYGFDWRDMGYGRCDATRAMTGLRRDLGAAGRALASAQPDLAARSAVGAAASLGMDLFYYLPPRDAVWALLGRALELGGAVAPFEPYWWRVGGALKVQNLFQGLSSDPATVSLLPVAGFEFVPAALGSAFFQLSFLARGGYLVALKGDGSCSGSAGKEIGGCSRPEVEAGAAAAVAGLLRIQLVAEWYPPARGAPGLWAIAPAMGLQVSF